MSVLTLAPFTSIPSPSQGVWQLGPFPLRAYALAIILGIVVAVWIGERRWSARGGEAGVITDCALWGVPFGIVGGRIYHVLTSWGTYFGADGDPGRAWKIWEGGLGIWGAVLLGSVGVWIGCRRQGVPLAPVADAVAPGLVLAQAIGRFGNYFNQELFGRPTSLPWALEIDPDRRPTGFEEFTTFHPTFLYESLWCVGVFFLLIWADRRFTLGHGRVFGLYVAAYCLGRFWIEALRIDEAPDLFGLRWNNWVAVVGFCGAVVFLLMSNRRHPGREAPEELLPIPSDADADAEAQSTS